MDNVREVGLREWFAGQALNGLLSNVHYPPQGSGEPLDQFVAKVTDNAFRLAEGMMKQVQRLKKEQPTAWATSIGR